MYDNIFRIKSNRKNFDDTDIKINNKYFWGKQIRRELLKKCLREPLCPSPAL